MSYDTRYDDLARVLTGYSCNLKRGEKVMIDVTDVPDHMVIALIRAARKCKAIPCIRRNSSIVNREMLLNSTEDQYQFSKKNELSLMKGMDAYIAIRGADNIFETSDVPSSKMQMALKIMRPVQEWRINKTRWVVLRWPSSAMAQTAGMSTEAFEDFYFRVCTQDYARMTPGTRALKKVIDKANRVEIKGPGTDLSFSIKGMPGIICQGDRNIPDGEVYSCPLKDSVEGTISYNVPTVYRGIDFQDVSLTFEKGKIVKATANRTRELNKILDADPGARYIGEFSLGFNPHILHPMQDILFDEKIAGSFHFTPGQAYENADNGNRSQVHWDMVCIQRKDYGEGRSALTGSSSARTDSSSPKALHKLNPNYLLKGK
jgi:aminopeptidase